jgi:AcrR family transcriptional regulator
MLSRIMPVSWGIPAIRIAFRFRMKKRRAHITARKPPQQSGSRVTVEAILDGAIRVLEQAGSAMLTTTRIAHAAGVSVGTLCQYFPNRKSILDALQQREFQRTLVLMQEVMVDSPIGSTDELARAVIRGLFRLYGRAPELHRVLVVEGLTATRAGAGQGVRPAHGQSSAQPARQRQADLSSQEPRRSRVCGIPVGAVAPPVVPV